MTLTFVDEALLEETEDTTDATDEAGEPKDEQPQVEGDAPADDEEQKEGEDQA